MNAEILAVGTELLMGQIANTNAKYISTKLNELGINVYYHSVVGDNKGRLQASLKLALERCDLLIITGGLGPTADDITKETTAQLLEKELVLDDKSLNRIKAYFERIKKPMPKNNLKQALLPKNSIVIKNNVGTAPGCILEENGKVVVLLPGPPIELQPMFEDTVVPYLACKSPYTVYSKYLKFFGIGEAALEEKLSDLISKQTNPTIATYVKDAETTVRVTVKCNKSDDCNALLADTFEEIRKRLGDYLYSTENLELHEEVARLLLNNNISISTAESCTGGLIAAKLTSVPGISKVFNRSAVCYSNQAKIQLLNVSPDTLKQYGAVSPETAKEMAVGIRNTSGSDIGVSVTGIAGPDGGTEEKPVGLVYIALADKTGITAHELRLLGDRNRIRNTAALHVFDMIRKRLTPLS